MSAIYSCIRKRKTDFHQEKGFGFSSFFVFHIQNIAGNTAIGYKKEEELYKIYKLVLIFPQKTGKMSINEQKQGGAPR